MTGVGEIFNYAFNSLDMTSSANDIIVIQHADGTLHSSPFIVRFGKVKVLRPQDKVVTIEVNGQPTTAVMKIASDGTAYWVHAADGTNVGPYDSPIASPPQSPALTHVTPGAAPPPLGASYGHEQSLSPSLLPSNPPPGVRPAPSPGAPPLPSPPVAAVPADVLAAGNEPPPAKGSPKAVPSAATRAAVGAAVGAAAVSLPDHEIDPPLPQKPNSARAGGDSPTGAEVKRLDDAAPEELLVGSTSKPEARPVEGLLTSLAAEAAVSPGASHIATPNVGGGVTLSGPGSITGLPPPAHDSTPPASGDALGESPEASGLEPSGSIGLSGGLRLARFASTDMLDNLPIGHVSLNERADGEPMGAAAPDDDETDGPPLTNATIALQRQLHADPNAPSPDLVASADLDETTRAEPARSMSATIGSTAAADGEVASANAPAAPPGADASLESDEYSDSDDAFEPNAAALTLDEAAGRASGRASAEGPTYTRSVFANHHDLLRLNLNPGANTIRFSTGTTLRGKVDITATIFLWSESAKLVISDVDGTVTKSDVMGHIATFFGKDWTHPGLCSLYSKIAKNGYHFVYLTARSVSQVEQTRQFLFNVEQDGTRLPHGPVLTAPEKLFSALQQELSKKSHEFKIACLAQVRDAFPTHVKPFYAGFGNRIGDVIAYTASEISEHKIFIINKDSVIHICTVKRSYRDLSHMVDETFPARKADDDYLHEFHELRLAAAAFNEGSSAATLAHRQSADGSSNDGAVVATAGVAGATERSASPGSDGSAPASATALRSTSAASPTPARRSTMKKSAAPEAPADFNDFNFWRVDPTALISEPPARKSGSASAGGSTASAGTTPAHGPASASAEVPPQTPPAQPAPSRGWLGGLWGSSKPKPSPKPAPTSSEPSSPTPLAPKDTEHVQT